MFIDYLISIILALIMFSIGSSLKTQNFVYLFRNPKAVILGLVLQMLFLPVVTFLIVYWLPIHHFFKMGILILSFCPGGTTSNLISFLVDAEVALSIALTSINSFLILVTIPFFSMIAFRSFEGTSDSIHLSFGETFWNIILIVLLPVGIGMLFKHFFPRLSETLKNPLKYLTIILLAIMFLIKFFAPGEQGGSGITMGEILTILPVTLILHLLVMFTSYFSAKRLVSSHKSAVTIGIEVGLQNTTLALLITTGMLNNEEMAKPALTYAIFSFFTTFAFAWYMMRKGRQQNKSLT